MTKNWKKITVIGLSAVACALFVIVGFGLAYEGASHRVETRFDITTTINEADLKPGKNPASFQANGETIVGDLYLPADFASGKTFPIVIVNPPASGVKEQTAGIYAQQMSQRGFAAMAIDPRGFGGSGSQPLLLDAYRIASDINASIAFLKGLQFSRKDEIYSLGICAGAGFAGLAAVSNSDIKAVGMVSPFLTSREDNYPGTVPRLLMRSAGGLARALNTQSTGQLVPTEPEAVDQASGIVKGMTGYYLPGMPGDTPSWRNALSIISVGPVSSFAIYDDAAELSTRPVTMVIGAEAVSRSGAERLHKQLSGPKEKLVLQDADHFDLYYREDYVVPASDQIARFFVQH